MRFLAFLKSSPLLLMLPSVFLIGVVVWAVSTYEPLALMDPFSAQEASASPVDGAAAGGGAPMGQDDDTDASASDSAHAGNIGSNSNGAGTPGESAEAIAAEAALSGALGDGTWTGYAVCGSGNVDGWKPYYVATTVVVSGGAVDSITSIVGSSTGDAGDAALSWDPTENQAYLDWAIDGRTRSGTFYTGVKTQIESAIAAGVNPSSVDVVSGATYSSNAILNSYYDALQKSAASVGGEVSDASGSTSADGASGDAAPTPTALAASASDLPDTFGDGSWTGYAACGIGNTDDWKPYYVKVSVDVANGKVQAITDISGSSTGDAGDAALSWDPSENQAYLDWAADGRTRSGTFYTGVKTQIESAITAGENPSSVDAVSGATYSSSAIFDAYYAALRKSAASVGSAMSQSVGASTTVVTQTQVSDSGGDNGSNEVEVEVPTTDAALIDGEYRGYAFCEDEDNPSEWNPYYVIVDIEVADSRISSITDVFGDSEEIISPLYHYNASENGVYLNKAINGGIVNKGVRSQIQDKLDAGEEVTGIDTISGATWSSKAIINGYTKAVEVAVEAAEESAAA